MRLNRVIPRAAPASFAAAEVEPFAIARAGAQPVGPAMFHVEHFAPAPSDAVNCLISITFTW